MRFSRKIKSFSASIPDDFVALAVEKLLTTPLPVVYSVVRSSLQILRRFLTFLCCSISVRL